MVSFFSGNGDRNIIISTSHEDFIRGRGGPDRLVAKDGFDRIHGGSGDDEVFGGHGGDRIRTGGGEDFVDGGQSSDRIRTSGEDDTVLGGTGDDRIATSAGSAGDQAFGFIGEAAFSGTAGELLYEKGVVRGDVDGDGTADFAIEVKGSPVLMANDFLL